MELTSEFKCDDSMLELSTEDLKSELLKLKSSCKDYQQIMEGRSQEVYTLKRQIDLFKIQELEYQQEIENFASSESKKCTYLQDRILELETNTRTRSSESDSEELGHLQSECQLLRVKLAKLEENQSVLSSIDKKYDALLEENEILKSKYDFTYTRYANTLEELGQVNDQVKKLNEELEETRNTYASNSMDARANLEEQEEQIAMLRVELSAAQNVQQNQEQESHDSRGNSMFSEIYDNWKRLKQKNDNIVMAYKDARQERNRLLNEAVALRRENILMCTLWKTEGIEARQKDSDLINTYKYANEKLEALIKIYEEDLVKERNINYSSSDTHVSVYINMINSKNEEIEKLYKEFRQANGSTIMHRIEIREVNNKARKYLIEATQYKNELEQLRELNALERNITTTTNTKEDNDEDVDIDEIASAPADNSKCVTNVTGVTDLTSRSKYFCHLGKSTRDVASMTERGIPQARALAQPSSNGILRTEEQSPLLANTLTQSETSKECAVECNNDYAKKNDMSESNSFLVSKTAQSRKVHFEDSVPAMSFVNQRGRKLRPRGIPIDCSQMIVLKRQTSKKL